MDTKIRYRRVRGVATEIVRFLVPANISDKKGMAAGMRAPVTEFICSRRPFFTRKS